MTFDEDFKELARAHDAIDRLRDAQERLESATENRERQRDIRIRAVLLFIICIVVFYAYRQM